MYVCNVCMYIPLNALRLNIGTCAIYLKRGVPIFSDRCKKKNNFLTTAPPCCYLMQVLLYISQ